MTHVIAAGRVQPWDAVDEAPRKVRPDEQALQALERGDRRTALVILMSEYGSDIHRYCYKILRNAAAADDVHQQVFIQAYEGFGAFSGGSSLRTWLYAIANHRCLDACKASRRWFHRFKLSGAETPDEVDPAPSGEDRVAARSVVEALDGCLEKLEPHVRIAVVLRYQEGFTYEQMAQICQDKPATLQARVARAMPLLRRCLENKGVDLR
jgi:RNA polymerase sigma-70 factor (ECF subfamily)